MPHPCHSCVRRLAEVRRASALLLLSVGLAMIAATGFAGLYLVMRTGGL